LFRHPTAVGTPMTVTNGVMPKSAPQFFVTVGSYSWNAAYSGDSNNNGIRTPCGASGETLTVVTSCGCNCSCGGSELIACNKPD